MFEITKPEREYCDRLTVKELQIYTSDNKHLAALDTWNEAAVHSFVNASRLMNELHRLHTKFNEIMDQFDTVGGSEELAIEIFKMTISIGDFSAVFDLSCMDECDALYGYLAKVKMNRFDWLADNFDIDVLTETIEFHDM